MHAVLLTACAPILITAWLGAAPATAPAAAAPQPDDAQIILWIERMWDPDKHSRDLSTKARVGLLKADRAFLAQRLEALYAAAGEDDTRRTWITKTINVLAIVLLTQKKPDDPLVKAGHAFSLKLLQAPENRSHQRRLVWLNAANNLKMNRDLRVVAFYIDRMTDPKTSIRFRIARVKSLNLLLAANWNPEAFREESRLPALRKELTEWWEKQKPFAEYFFEEGKVYRPYIRVNWLRLEKNPTTGEPLTVNYLVQWIATNSAWKVDCPPAIRKRKLTRKLDVKAKTLRELVDKTAAALSLKAAWTKDTLVLTAGSPQTRSSDN